MEVVKYVPVVGPWDSFLQPQCNKHAYVLVRLLCVL